MDSAVIDLPLPDSPTMPRLLPVSSLKLTPSTARLTPRRLCQMCPEVGDFEQGHARSLQSGACCSRWDCHGLGRGASCTLLRLRLMFGASKRQACAVSGADIACDYAHWHAVIAHGGQVDIVPRAVTARLTRARLQVSAFRCRIGPAMRFEVSDAVRRRRRAKLGDRSTRRRSTAPEGRRQGRCAIKYIGSRVLQAFVTLVLFMIILFVATRAAGDPALLILPADATPEQIRIGARAHRHGSQLYRAVPDLRARHGDAQLRALDRLSRARPRPDRRPDHRSLKLHFASLLLILVTAFPLGVLPRRIAGSSPITSCGWWRRSARPRRASGSGWC